MNAIQIYSGNQQSWLEVLASSAGNGYY